MKVLKKEELKKLHNIQVEMLLDIDKFCRDNNLTYFLCGGTLLGSIRHQGFIPWDDDVDIGMPRSDYLKFIKLYNQNNKSKYYVECIENSNEYFYSYAKVRKSNTLFMETGLLGVTKRNEIFIDIFPFDNAPGDYSKIKIRANLIKAMNESMRIKVGMYDPKKCYHKIFSKIFLPFSLKTIYKMQMKLMMKDFKKETSHMVCYIGGYKTSCELMPKDVFLPTKLGDFEGHKFNIMNKPEIYLERLYGNYMQLPPVSERVNHDIVEISFDLTNDNGDL